MNSFLENNTDGGNTFLLYGNLNDWFCTNEKECLEFDDLLLRVLKSRGYEHVVFYGGAGNRGKHCLDKASSEFFFGDAAHSRPGQSAPETPAEAVEVSEGVSPSEMMRANSERRRRRSSVERRCQEEPAADAGGGLSSPSQNGTRFSQVSISNGEFIQEITTRANRRERFAVVFYNIFDFISGGNETDRRFIDQIISMLDKPSSEVLCIFEAPSDPDINHLCRDLERSPLGIKFLRSENGNTVLNGFNCIHIGAPGEDEIRNLLAKLMTQPHNGRRLKFDMAKLGALAHELNGQIRANSSDDPSLKRIRLCLERWMDSQPKSVKEVWLDRLRIAQIFDSDVTEEIPTLERLRRVRGWEQVYEMVNNAVSVKRAQIRKNRSCTPKKPEEADICVERLSGRRTVRQTSNVEVPNFVLEGNPGTGKTTIGRMIADILYEDGILPTNNYVLVSKAELTSSLIAGIPRAVMACADRAEGGVLIIDEAPLLAHKDGGVNNEGSAQEVISTLNRIMTDPTRRLCVVLCGYTEGMEKLFNDVDPGFRGRFAGNEVVIEDYKPDLLGSILRSKLKKMGPLSFTVDPELYSEENAGEWGQPLDNYLDHLYLKRDRRTFNNARSMETLAEKLSAKAIGRGSDVIIEEDFYGISPCSEKEYDDTPDIVDHSWFEPVNPSDSFEALEREIRENTVGLEFLIDIFRNYYDRVMEARANGVPEDKLPVRSIVLVGNPGTGKDLVANLFGRLFRILNILNSPSIIRHDGGDLASNMSGGSVMIAKEWVKEAKERNALLFINEGHQLASDHFDGKGALRAFIAPMTDKGQFVTVFAVYPSELQAFYKLDSGLESRLDVIRLPDYNDVQLYEIFLKMARKKGILIDSEDPEMKKALYLVSRVCVRLCREAQANSGNARQLENLLEKMDDRRSGRCRRNGILYEDIERRMIFCEEDVPKEWLKNLPAKGCLEKNADDFAEIERELTDKVVGRSYLRDKFRDLADETREERFKGNEEFWPDPMILSGRPGAGKTMIGRLLARLYNILGVVKCPEPITFDASALSSVYKNGERAEVERLIEIAREKKAMIYVDEAHQLLDLYDGRGVIQAFIAPMNDPDPDRRVLVVFSVYDDRLDEFIACDNGLHRRVENQIIHLEDYTGPELKEIFMHMAKNKGVTVDPALEAELDSLCGGLYENRTPISGNAGLMENLLSAMNECRRRRCREQGIELGDEDYFRLIVDDIPEYYSNRAYGAGNGGL